MHNAAVDIVLILQKAGYQAYFAGGKVRDMLMGKVPYDIDIVTDARPEVIEKLLPKTFDVGKQFGVIRALFKGHHFEIATFRSDSGYTDGRRPDAIFYSSPKEDAKRRDFTINAIFYDPIADEIIDYEHGEDDLKAKLIRFVGNPDVRIKEDHLRIMRAVRFKNQLHFQYHPDTYQALKKYAHLITYVSADRIRDELEKILNKCSPRSKALYDLYDLGILDHILPEITALKGIAQPYKYHQEGDVLKHTMKAVSSLPHYVDIDVLFAVLFHDIGKAKTFSLSDRIRFDGHISLSADMAEIILKRLNFPNKRREKIIWLIKHHMILGNLLTMPENRKRRWFLDPWFIDLLWLFKADIMGSRPIDFSLYNQVVNTYKHTLEHLPKKLEKFIDGHDVMKSLNLSPGKKIRDILHEIEDLQIEGKIKNRKEALVHIKKIGRAPKKVIRKKKKT